MVTTPETATIGANKYLINLFGYIKQADMIRVRAFIYHPNNFTIYLSLACIMGFVAQALPLNRNYKKLGTIVIAMAIFIVCTGMYRGAFMVWGAVFIGLKLVPESKLQKAGRFICAAAAGFYLLLAVVQSYWVIFPLDLTWDLEGQGLNFSISKDYYCYYYLHRAGIMIFFDYPLLGAGPGMFNLLMMDPEYLVSFTHYPYLKFFDPHNTYFGYLAETGVLGLGAYLVFFGLVWRQARDLATKASPWAPLGQMMAPYLVLLLLQGYFLDIVTLRYLYFVFALILAAVSLSGQNKPMLSSQ